MQDDPSSSDADQSRDPTVFGSPLVNAASLLAVTCELWPIP